MIHVSATMIDRINRMVRQFVWGNKRGPVEWRKVCLLHVEGGLGLRDLSVWNKTMLSKTLWNIHAKKESLWIRWIHAEYLRGDDIWNISKKPRNSSFLKNILDIRDDLVVSNCARDISKAKELLTTWFENKGLSAVYNYMRTQGLGWSGIRSGVGSGLSVT